MKFLLALIAVAMLSSCTERTQYGSCVGAFDDDVRDPKLQYKVSGNNIFWAIVGWELIFPPVIVVLDETYCPIGEKP